MEETFFGWVLGGNIVRVGFGELWPALQWCLHARLGAWSQDSRLLH
jgi:hypothetical protein